MNTSLSHNIGVNYLSTTKSKRRLFVYFWTSYSTWRSGEQRWTGHFREPSNLHHHWITPRITGSALSSYLPWHDSMWQTIVCCHITQAELIVGEHWVSPPRQPEEQSRMWSNGMRKDAQRRDELCRWWWMVACCSFCGLGVQRLMIILSSNLVYEKANYLEN